MLRRSTNCRDEHGCWTFGGGGLKFNEMIEEALMREMKEEIGTEPYDIEFVSIEEFHREHEGRPTHWIGLYYKGAVDPEKVFNAEPDMHDEIGWFTVDALPEPLAGSFGERFKRIKHKF